MVYSTCSILKEENEGLLKRVLKSSGGELVPIGGRVDEGTSVTSNAMPGTLLVGPDELFEGFCGEDQKNRSSARSFYFCKNALSFYAALRFSTSIRFSSGMIVISIVRMQAVPPMTLETGSSEEYAVGPHMHDVGEKVGQRYNDEYLCGAGEEDRKDLLIQGFKYRLTDVLEVHKDKSCKIHVQRRNCILDQRRVRAENTDQRFRDEDDHVPRDGRVAENKETR